MATHASPKDLLTLANALDGTASLPIAGAVALSSTLAVTGAVTAASTIAATGAITGLQKTQTVAANAYTVVNATGGDMVIFAAANNDVITLPNAAAGNLGQRVTVINTGGANIKVSISPHSSDKIIGGVHGAATGDLVSFSGTADKDAINTGATALKGDHLILVSDGVDSWFTAGGKGVWASEA